MTLRVDLGGQEPEKNLVLNFEALEKKPNFTIANALSTGEITHSAGTNELNFNYYDEMLQGLSTARKVTSEPLKAFPNEEEFENRVKEIMDETGCSRNAAVSQAIKEVKTKRAEMGKNIDELHLQETAKKIMQETGCSKQEALEKAKEQIENEKNAQKADEERLKKLYPDCDYEEAKKREAKFNKILEELFPGVSPEEARARIDKAGFELRVEEMMEETGCTRAEAEKQVKKEDKEKEAEEARLRERFPGCSYEEARNLEAKSNELIKKFYPDLTPEEGWKKFNENSYKNRVKEIMEETGCTKAEAEEQVKKEDEAGEAKEKLQQKRKEEIMARHPECSTYEEAVLKDIQLMQKLYPNLDYPTALKQLDKINQEIEAEAKK